MNVNVFTPSPLHPHASAAEQRGAVKHTAALHPCIPNTPFVSMNPSIGRGGRPRRGTDGGSADAMCVYGRAGATEHAPLQTRGYYKHNAVQNHTSKQWCHHVL